MDDLISRQAAIDAARDWYEGLICGSFKGLEKRLRALPSVQPGEDIRAMCGECDAWNQYKNYPQPGKEGQIYIGGRLFGVRELAQ